MKVNKQFLLDSILEIMESDNITPKTDFEKLMTSVNSDWSNVNHALQMFDIGAYKLTPDEKEHAIDVFFDAIIEKAPKDEKPELLDELGFDWHNEFYEVFGIYPPKNLKFEVEESTNPFFGGKIVALRTKIKRVDPPRESEIEFHFWLKGSNPHNPSDPWIYIMASGKEGELTNVVFHHTGEELEVEIDGSHSMNSVGVTFDEIPKIIRRELGLGPDEDIAEWPELPKVSTLKLETLTEDEEETDSFQQLYAKVGNWISAKDLGFTKQGFEIIETYEMADLISKEEANNLRESLWMGVWEHKLYSADTIDEIIELSEEHTTLSKEFKTDLEHNIYYYGSYAMSDEWALKYALKKFDLNVEIIDPDNLYAISGGNQETFEKAKERLMEFGEEEQFFAWDIEEGRLLYGVLARPYVEFEKKIKEIFGATPAGDPSMGGGVFRTIAMRKSIEEPFDSPMVKGGKVTAEIMFEWEPETEYGMELTLTPAKLPSTPQALLDDYYGIWVSTSKDGPNVGQLEIGVQNYEDEFASHARIQNDRGTYGFTPEEMKAKIKEMVGIDLDELDAVREGRIREDLNEEELLHEAWDSQWPSHFHELKTSIKDFTDKGTAAEDILAKYALEAMSFNFLGFKAIWDAYGRLFKAFVRTYVRDEGDLRKIRKLITNNFSPKVAMDWKQKFSDARRDKGNEGALRVLNKLITSLDKQIRRNWRSMEDKGVDWNNVEEEFDREITQSVQKQQFREASLITSRILEIINFVNMDKGDDNAKKLAAFYKKIKQAANSPEIDVSAIADEVNIVQLSLDFVEDQRLNIDMTLCPDAEVGAPCVMHNFEDGFFWYDISADTCDLTARKMNSCGDASMDGSELFNLMSHSETGKPRWHVTVEWNEEEKAFIQVLGNSNTVPKQEYWPHIKWLYEKYGKPEISNYAWEHVRGDNVKSRVYGFLQYLGLKSRQPTSETWVQMKQQISDGFYNVRSWGDVQERPDEDDWSKLTWIPHADRVAMAMRIKRRLIPTKSIETGIFEYEDVRDYKAAARKLENAGTLGDLLFQDMIPPEWNEFFSSEGITQRVRFSHGGNMILYFNWTTKKLQDPSDGNYRDDEYMKQLQREMLARFMNETKQNFNVGAMTTVGRLMGKYLENYADDWAMERDAYNRGDDLDEESQKILNELIKLSKIKKD